MTNHSEWVVNDFVQVEVFFVYFEALVLHLRKVKQVKHQVPHHLGCVLHCLNPHRYFVNFFSDFVDRVKLLWNEFVVFFYFFQLINICRASKKVYWNK